MNWGGLILFGFATTSLESPVSHFILAHAPASSFASSGVLGELFVVCFLIFLTPLCFLFVPHKISGVAWKTWSH